MTGRIIESTAMPSQTALSVPGGSVSQAVILKQQQDAALQTARNKIGGKKRRHTRIYSRRTNKHYRGSARRRFKKHYRGSVRRYSKKHYRGSVRRRSRKHYRGGATTPVIQVPPTPVGADSATKANYELLTKVAQQQQTNAIFDKATTPADTAVINAKQQSLYSM